MSFKCCQNQIGFGEVIQKRTTIVELDKGEPEEMVLNNLKEMGCLFKQINENEKFIKIKILNEN